MDKYFMWIHYERLHNHNKAKHNKTVCIFLGIYCIGKVMDMRLSCYLIFLSVKANQVKRQPQLMMTSSNGKKIPRYWLFVRRIHRSPVNPPRETKDAELWFFSLIYVWRNGSVNNFRRHRAPYGVTLMSMSRSKCIVSQELYVSNHRCLDCLFNCLPRRRPKIRVTCLCEGISPAKRWIPIKKGPVTRKCFHLMTS